MYELTKCDICNKYGEFDEGNFYGFIGFTQQELKAIGLSHLDEESVRCDKCLMLKNSIKIIKEVN